MKTFDWINVHRLSYPCFVRISSKNLGVNCEGLYIEGFTNRTYPMMGQVWKDIFGTLCIVFTQNFQYNFVSLRFGTRYYHNDFPGKEFDKLVKSDGWTFMANSVGEYYTNRFN